jgi:hypothetical protein
MDADDLGCIFAVLVTAVWIYALAVMVKALI